MQHRTRRMAQGLFRCLLLAGGLSAAGCDQLLEGNARVEGVVVTPAAGTLDARPAGLDPEPGFVTETRLEALVQYANGKSDKEVTWSVSDPELARCEEGVLTTLPDASAGTLVVTATSKQDPTIKGQATFTIRAVGRAEAEVK